DAQLAPEIIATLKEKKIGQAALVLPGLSNSSPATLAAPPKEAIAWAQEKTKAPDSLAPVVARLLHNVAIFRDLDGALSFKKHGGDFAVATLAGEFISAEGIVFGGSRDVAADSLLERKARMSVLSAECAAIRSRHDELLQKRDDANAMLEKAAGEFEEARRQYESFGREQSTCDNRIFFLEQESQESEQKIDQLRSEQTVLAQQIQTADERIAKLEKELSSERSGLEARQDQQLELQGARENAAKREEEATEKLNELRLALATERERYENLVAQRQPMTAREAELAETIAARQADIANFEKRLAAQSQESKIAEAAIEKEKAECAELEATVVALTDQRAEHVRAMNEMESKLRAIRNSLNELHDLRSKQQVRETQL